MYTAACATIFGLLHGLLFSNPTSHGLHNSGNYLCVRAITTLQKSALWCISAAAGTHSGYCKT